MTKPGFKKAGAGLRLAFIAASLPLTGLFALPASAQITFEQVFENPDNPQLNLEYAKQEAAAGNLLQAASTLERLLYAEPNWDSARIFYADVLLQLDDRQAASREMILLENRPLTASQRADLVRINQVVTGAPKAKNPRGISGRASVGVRIDDNGANALTDVVNPSSDQDDVSLIARASLGGRTPIVGGLDLLGDAGAYFRLPSEDASRSYSNLHINLGIGGGEQVEWDVRMGARSVGLDGDDFLTEIGPRAGLGFSLNDTTTVRLGGAAVYQDYEFLPNLPNEQFRTGQKYSVMGSVSHKASDKTRIGASLGFDDKRAKADILAYDAWRVGANVFHTVSADHYLRGNVSYRSVSYDGLNGFVTPAVAREDEHIYARAAYGVRLSAIADMFSAMDSVFLEGAVDVIDRGSNIAVFDYDNVGASLSLNWDF